MGGLCMVYVTAPTAEEAAAIGRVLVEARLAACANVFDGLRSIYRWQGRIEDAREAALILKTREELVPALTEKVRALHSYACPCVVSLPLTGGSADFLAWIRDETAPAGGT